MMKQHPDDELSIQEAAELTGRSPEAIRVLCRQCLIGRLDTSMIRSGVWRISRRELVELWKKRHGIDGLPAALRDDAA
jgi:hypothetical protein